MTDSLLKALAASELGVLVVAPQDIAAQLSKKISSTIIFAFKDVHMELSRHLIEARNSGQLHRIDIDILKVGAWTKVHAVIRKTLNLA